MKYAIVVISEKLEIRNSNLADILEQEEDYILREDSKFIGCSGIDKYIKINIKKQKPKFLNWYDNINYINMWNSKEEAELFLN